MHPNAQLIEQFYTAFSERRIEDMLAVYHRSVVFSDPVFMELQGDRARAMWRMLLERGRSKPTIIEFRDVDADDRKGRAHWEAHYSFGPKGRPVHNIIEAEFEFEDGLIRRHRDTFDLPRWAGQALGAHMGLLAHFPPIRNAIRANVRKTLDAYVAR
jgi:hypothetical protein